MKNKIKYIKIGFILMLIMPFWSCGDFLDVVPTNIAVIEEAFDSRDNAERFLATLYGYLPNYTSINNPGLSASDEISVNDNLGRFWGGSIIAKGGQSKTGPLLGSWGGSDNLFIAIRDCNIFLANVDKPFDLDDFEKERWIAEAKILKAYFHFYLMRMYGPIPITRENIEVSEGLDAVRVFRDPVDEVADYIVELLDEAMASPELPTLISDVGTELGRLTLPIAASLKAKVLVTVASPLFNGNSDYGDFKDSQGRQLISTTFDQGKWDRAAVACKEAIDIVEAAGGRLFVFNPSDISSASDTTLIKLSVRGAISDPWNNELIWGSSSSPINRTLQSWALAKINPLLTAESRESVQSYWSPTLRMAEMFYSNNGVPIEEDVNYPYADRYNTRVADSSHFYDITPGDETAVLNFEREPRFYGFLGFDKGKWEGHGQLDHESFVVYAKKGERAGQVDARRWSLSGYFAKKLVHYEAVQSAPGSGFSAETYPFPIMRLGGLYLLYAETLVETNNLPEARVYIDKVRERAGLNGVLESWENFSSLPNKPNTQEGLRSILRQERLIEMCFEGQRLWDLRRWKEAEVYMNTPIVGWNIEGQSTATYYTIVNNGRFQFSLRDYLWPISEQDILTNPNLIQNPGW